MLKPSHFLLSSDFWWHPKKQKAVMSKLPMPSSEAGLSAANAADTHSTTPTASNMKSFDQLNRPTKWAGAALALVATMALIMPTQAATLFEQVATLHEHLCTRFCGHHCHHHGHEWCGGYEHFWCPGHH